MITPATKNYFATLKKNSNAVRVSDSFVVSIIKNAYVTFYFSMNKKKSVSLRYEN